MTSLPSQPLPPDLAVCLERADEVMGKKPGLVRDLLLDKTVELGIPDPRFIPSFLKEGIRITSHNEQLSVVRQLFAKAHEVEEVRGPPIDEGHHRRVFRELFSLGALGAAELMIEVASLPQCCPTGETLGYFVGLAADCARIGTPPYLWLAADVWRLTDTVGADRVVVENRLLCDLLETVYLSRAPEDFWRSYRDRLVDLAGQDPRIRLAPFGLSPVEVESDT